VWGNLFENLIQLVNIIGSVFYGTILGIFLVAIFIKHVQGKAVFWAALLSEAIILTLFSYDVVSFLWLNVIGAVLTVLFALFFQLILGRKIIYFFFISLNEPQYSNLCPNTITFPFLLIIPRVSYKRSF
jgi:hypothetical protein